MRNPILTLAATVSLAAAAVTATASAAAPATPQAWMSATCRSLTSVQSGVTGIAHTDTTGGKTQSLAALKAIGATTDALIATTSVAMPKTPHGAAIALSLHTAARGFRRALSTRQTALVKSDSAALAKTAVALQTQSSRLGAAFVHVDLRYSSPVLDATIDQTPSCELVHG